MSVRLDGTETFVDAGTVQARHTTLPPECAVGMGEANGDGRLVDRGRHVATCDGPTGFVIYGVKLQVRGDVSTRMCGGAPTP